MTTSNRCRLLLALAILLCADFAFAQQTQNNSGFISSTQCIPVPASGMSSAGYSVTGAWSGTLTAYGIVGQGAAVSLGSETANGSYTLSIPGYTLFEVCGNTVGSGAAYVQVYSSSASSGTGGSGISSLTLQNNGSTVATSSSATTLNFLSGCTSTYSTGTFSITCSGGSMTWPGAAGIANYSGSNSWNTSYSATNLIPANFLPAALANSTSVNGTSIPASDTLVDLAGSQSLTNKTLDGVSPTTMGYLDATSSIQTQLTARALLSGATFTGEVKTPASTTGSAGLNLPHGSAPTSPVNGDCWTTTLGLYCQINGATVGPFGTGSGGISGLTTGLIPKAGSATSIVNSSCDDGITTANTFTCSDSAGITASAGPITAAAPSGKAGMFALGGNTTNQTIPTNDFAWGGFSSASATAYGLQPPNSAPSGGQVMSFPTPTSGWSQGTWVTPGTGSVTSIATTSPITGGTITTTGTIACATCVVASSPGVGLAHFAGSTQTATSSAVVGGDMANNTVTATQLAAQYSKGSCTEVWGGTNTGNALQSGDDAISNNTCYNDSGVTRTITAVKCRADIASNTTTVNPTFGSAGTGTTILSGALTCGSSYAYSSTGTVSNASWTTGSGIDPAMGGTLTGTSIAMIVEYTF